MRYSRSPQYLNLDLPSEKVSLAWAYLANAESYPPQPIPPELENLSSVEWYLLEQLLQQQLSLKASQPLH